MSLDRSPGLAFSFVRSSFDRRRLTSLGVGLVEERVKFLFPTPFDRTSGVLQPSSTFFLSGW